MADENAGDETTDFKPAENEEDKEESSDFESAEHETESDDPNAEDEMEG